MYFLEPIKGISFLDVFLIYLFYVFFDNYVWEFDIIDFWLVMIPTLLDEYYHIFDLFIGPFFFNLSTIWVKFFTDICAMYASPLLGLPPNNEIFYINIDNHFPINDLFDWWHDAPLLDDFEEWISLEYEFMKKEDERYFYYGDIYSSYNETSENWPFIVFGKSWEKESTAAVSNNLTYVPWKKQIFFFGGRPLFLRSWWFGTINIPRFPIKEAFGKYLRDEVPVIDITSNIEALDIDWTYLTRVYPISDWNYKAVLPLVSFYLGGDHTIMDNFDSWIDVYPKSKIDLMKF